MRIIIDVTYKFLFPSLAFSISEAYLIPSCPLSIVVRCPANFFRLNRLPQFYQTFFIFDLCVHNNMITHGIRIFICCCELSLLKFDHKKLVKIWFFLGFWPLSQNCSMWDHETWFAGISEIVSVVYKLWPTGAIFLVPFWPWIGPKLGQK